MPIGAVTLLGHGRLGSALAEGWTLTGVVPDLTVLTRSAPPDIPAGTQALVVAVKPAVWREAVVPLLDVLPADATVISVMAGVCANDIAAVFAGRRVARVMPTTGVALAQGVAAIWSADPIARALAHTLFDPVADTVDLDEEAMIDAATAVAGSAPAFFYALAKALAAAGTEAGLSPDASSRLTRGALRSAAAGAGTAASLDELMARIASPGGTTRAGLDALGHAGLNSAARAAVTAAIQRSVALAGNQPP